MRYFSYQGFDEIDWSWSNEWGDILTVKGATHDSFRDYLAEQFRASRSELFVVPVSIHLNNWCRRPELRTPDNWIKRLSEFSAAVAEYLIPMLHQFPRCPDRHIFFQTGDNDATLSCLSGSLVFKESITDQSTDHAIFYPSTLGFAPRQIDACDIDVSFQGCLGTFPPVRSYMKSAMFRIKGQTRCICTSNHFYNLSAETRTTLRDSYQLLLDRSKFILCPRGSGVNSIRFFEAMQCGRIPVLIADHIKLPLSDIIPYEEFVVHVPEDKVLDAGLYIEKFCKTHSLATASHLSSDSYSKFTDMQFFLDMSLKRAGKIRHW